MYSGIIRVQVDKQEMAKDRDNKERNNAADGDL